MLHTLHNVSRYTVIGNAPSTERTCYLSLSNLLFSVTKVGVNLNIDNWEEDGDILGPAQEQEQ